MYVHEVISRAIPHTQEHHFSALTLLSRKKTLVFYDEQTWKSILRVAGDLVGE